MGWSRELDKDPGVPVPNPHHLGDGDADYKIWIKHVLPKKRPAGAKQMWQVVECFTLTMDAKCKWHVKKSFIVDIVDIAKRKKIDDTLSFFPANSDCFALEICKHTVGFDDGKSNYAQVSSLGVRREAGVLQGLLPLGAGLRVLEQLPGLLLEYPGIDVLLALEDR